MGCLDDKVAIVTGASSGIGRATALLLGKEGAKVIVADINEAGAASTVEAIAREGGQATAVTGDTSVNKEVQQIIGTTLSTYGAIDLLHNNAGILRTFATPEEHSEDHWQQILAVNLTGVFLMARAVVPVMRGRGGTIINMASMAAVHPYPSGLAYAASKAGVLNFSRSLAEAVTEDGIRVNAICPGGVDTPILNWGAHNDPKKRARLELMDPVDIGRLVLYLATHSDIQGQVFSARKINGVTRFHYVDVTVSDQELFLA